MVDNLLDTALRKILFEPVSLGTNRLCILSAHASPSMASWLLKTYEEKNIRNISVELIITSTLEESISQTNHDGFTSLHKSYRMGTLRKFFCSYLYRPCDIQENLYIWVRNEKPLKAFASSEFTQAEILRSRIDISECNPLTAYKTFATASNNSIYCDHAEIDEYVIIGASNLPKASDMMPNDPNYISLSLIVKRTGEPGIKSGLNWGQRDGRNPNEAYISLPRKIAKSGFFPLKKQHFLVVTDDHHTLLLRVEQQNDKAITTPASNAQLGEYFRNRLGLPNGAYIHTSNLDAYGRRDVSFYKIDEDQYYMDFSSNKGKRLND